MKRLGIFFLFLSAAILLGIVLTEFAGLSLEVSMVLAGVTATLIYLMLDTQPDEKEGTDTIIRLSRPRLRK